VCRLPRYLEKCPTLTQGKEDGGSSSVHNGLVEYETLAPPTEGLLDGDDEHETEVGEHSKTAEAS